MSSRLVKPERKSHAYPGMMNTNIVSGIVAKFKSRAHFGPKLEWVHSLNSVHLASLIIPSIAVALIIARRVDTLETMVS